MPEYQKYYGSGANSNAPSPAISVRSGDYLLQSDPSDPSLVNVINAQTGKTVQTITTVVLPDGSITMSVSNVTSGSTWNSLIGGNGQLLQTSTLQIVNGTLTETRNSYDSNGNVTSDLATAALDNWVGSTQFQTDNVYNNLDAVAAAAGVSVSTLLGLNPALSSTGTIAPGTLVTLPTADNSQSPTITVNPNPQPLSQTQGENTATNDTNLGYVSNSATSSIGFSNGTLNKTDFVSVTEAGLASDGVRPGEVQADPNTAANQILADIGSSTLSGLNALAAIGSTSASQTSNVYIDPLLLDLGQGIVTTSEQSSGVLFNVDNSGTLHQTGWVASGTGMLVVPDANGQVTSMSQIFSPYYGGKAGTNGGPGTAPFASGIAALASFDSNHDGVIDANDPLWSQLRVWVNSTGPGTGQMLTLAQLGITSINLSATGTRQINNGNIVTSLGSFVMNGAARTMEDVNLVANPAGSTFSNSANSVTATTTSSGTQVTTYQDTTSQNLTLDAGALGVNNIYAGSGNDTLNAAAGGSWLVGGSGSDTFNGGAGNDVFVVSANDNPTSIHGNGGVDTVVITGNQGMTVNMAQEGVTIAEGGAGNDVIMSGGRTGVYIKGGTGDDTLIGGGGTDVIVGGSGHNLIIGGSGQAEITSGPNGDTIYASAAGSIINAGGGADHIFGGAGNDLIKVGGGNAAIDGGGGTNIVQFHGSYGEYRIVAANGGYYVADKVPNRDGTVFITNIQKLNFSDIQAVDLSLPDPMPVSDTLHVDGNGKTFDHTQPHLISAAQLLANDQRLNSTGSLHIASVGSAIGGSVTLTASGDVLFTPTAGYTGIMSFKYGVADAAGHTSAVVQDLNSGQTAAMQAEVSLMTPDLPTDPLLAQEWYLSDADILPVWKDYTGKGVRIGQFEPGGQFATGPEVFDYTHPDLAPSVDQAWMASQLVNGTLPTETSQHATMVAGVMVAADNGTGGVGVAYNATVAGYYLANSGSDLSGLGHEVSYDIANNSWDFTNDFAVSNMQNGQINTASALITNAQYAADNGRGGLGTIIVEAGGNQRATGGNAEGSLTNNNRFSIEVGAINAQSDLSTLQIGSAPFSNPGASLLVSAPGSNIESTSQMVMTDQGSTFGSAYSNMQGTSFATPIVSGVVALMLQANPNLGYRDVQAILALTARKVNDPNTQWTSNGANNWNGGGMHVSNDYGFGEVDARAAVRLAETWMTQSTGANEKVWSASSGAVSQTIQGGGTLSSSIAMQAGLNIEHVEIDLDANVGRLGDLIVTLVSPDGTQSVLLNREGVIPAGSPGASSTDVGSTTSGKFQYTFMSTHDWGEVSAGNWTLQVADAATGQPVTLNNWSLRLYGSTTTADHTYYYTDEYAAAVTANANAAVLDPAVNGTGGRNTIDAAAVSGDTSINLLTGTASIGGTALTIRNPDQIQNLVGGDGNDTLTANNANALLDGGRGSNTLTGGTGKDLFVVHARANGLDTIVNFNVSGGEQIDLVGFTGKQFKDLTLTQQGGNVVVGLGNGQTIVLQNQTVASLTAAQFVFQDTFVAPPAYVTTGQSSTVPPAGTDVITMSGGFAGVSLQGSTAKLAGTVYMHDAASSDIFVVSPQTGATDYKNALQGFRHGIDKIDVSKLGITSFADLGITLSNRMTINGVAVVHGANVRSTSLSAQLLYLDAIDPSQVTASDFIFATPAPGTAGTVATPVAPATPSSQSPLVTNPDSVDPTTIVGTNIGLTVSTAANGATTMQASIDEALPDSINILTLTGSASLVGTANNNGDTITGNAGNDTLLGGEGNDTLVAGTGNDLMIGGGGTNTYVVNAGGGVDTVQAGAGQVDTLVLQGVTPGTVQFSKQGNDLLVTLNPGQPNVSEVVVTGQFNGQGMGTIVVAGQSFSAATVSAIVKNGAVTVSQPSLTQTESSAAGWSYALPKTLFSSPVAGDVLTWSATLANGNPLPAGLTFDPVHLAFTGAQGIATGDLVVKVVATDLAGATASSLVTLHVVPVTAGSGMTLSTGSNGFAGQTGNGNTFNVSGNGSSVWLDGNSNTINVSGAGDSVTVGSNSAGDNVYGSGVTINASSGDTLGVYGSSNLVAEADGSGLWLNGSSNTVYVNGAGDSVTIGSNFTGNNVFGSGATINAGSNDTFGVYGSSNVVRETNNSGVWLNGSSSTVYATGSGDSVTVGSNDTGNNVYGSGVIVNAGSGDTLGVYGSSNVVTEGAGSGLWLNGSSSTVYANGNGDSVTVGSNDTGNNIFGSGVTINAGSGDTLGVYGSSNVVTEGSGSGLWLNGSSSTVYANGNGDSVTIGSNFTGNNVFGSGVTVNASSNDTFGVYGSSNVVREANNSSVSLNGSSSTVYANGSGDSVTVGSNDTGNNVFGSGVSINAGSGDTLGVYGSSNVVTEGAGSGIWLNGSSNTVNASGNGDSVTVTGGANNSIIVAGSSSTVVLGDGAATVQMTGASSTVTVGHGAYSVEFGGTGEQLRFGADVSSSNLWFQEVGQDLQITVDGTGESVTLKNWYAATPERAGSIVAGDGKTLSASSVNQLVQAMAAFAPPAAGQTSLPAAEQQTLQPVLAASWR
ncbi:proconvertase P-domain protein [Burkholderia sp. MSHR3999]|nr:proconvertase P-domain protein [Burkholderia sp. MSHR3999]